MIARLAGLSLPPAAYDTLARLAAAPAVCSARHRRCRRRAMHSPIADGVVRAQIRTKPGEPLNLETLEGDLKRIYSIDTFEKADFRLTEQEGKTGLVIETKEKSMGALLSAASASALDDDFRGSATYNISANLTTTALNRLGAEWQNQLQIGDTPRFFSEFYQPLDEGLRYFIAPRIEYRSWNINNYSGWGPRSPSTAPPRTKAGLDVGRQFENWGQVRLGLRRGYGNVGVRVGPPEPEVKFNSGGRLHLILLQPARQLQLSPPRDGRATWSG